MLLVLFCLAYRVFHVACFFLFPTLLLLPSFVVLPLLFTPLILHCSSQFIVKGARAGAVFYRLTGLVAELQVEQALGVIPT